MKTTGKSIIWFIIGVIALVAIGWGIMMIGG